MPSPNRTRLSLLCLFALLAASGCGEEEDVSPSYEDRIPVGVALDGPREVKFGDEATLAGRVTQGDEVLESRAVRLEEDPYPFDDSWRAVDTQPTDDRGRFEFDVDPEINTLYRAVADAGAAISDERTVYVDPVASVESAPAGVASTRFTTTFRHARDRPLDGAVVFSYGGPVIQAQTAGSVPFVGIERAREVEPGLSTASIVLPGTPGELAYEVCVSYAPDNAVGEPRADCGRGRRPFDG